VFYSLGFGCIAEWPSFRILKPPECLVLVVTGSWAPSPTLRAGLSGCSASFLVMSSCTLSGVVGASVSRIAFGHPRGRMKLTLVSFPSRSSSHASHLPLLSGFQFCRHVLVQPLLLPPAHPHLGFPQRQPERDPALCRGLAARRARRDVLLLCAEPPHDRHAAPTRRLGPRAPPLVLQSRASPWWVVAL